MKKNLHLISRATLIAGTLDICAAFIQQAINHVPPLRVLQAIASGLLGAEAFRGGLPVAALGAVLHFLLMAGFAALYLFLLAGRRFAETRPLLTGATLGVAIYVVMNALVLPLSRIPFVPKYGAGTLMSGLFVHVLCVGLPIVYVCRSGRDAIATAARA